MTDPILRNRMGFLIRHAPPVKDEWCRKIDAVLISHLHHDHLDLPSLKRLPKDTKIVAPRGSSKFLRGAGLSCVEELEVGDSTAIGDIEVTATFAAHGGFRIPFGPHAEALGYLINGSRRIYFAGDTHLFLEMDGLGSPLDIALLPVGGWGLTLPAGHLNPWTATEALTLLRPRVVVPVHWGTLWTLGFKKVLQHRFSQPGPEFARLASLRVPQTTVCLTSPGQPVELPKPFDPVQ